MTEANKLSRALGLSVRYNMFQNGKKDVWVEVYEARTLVKRKGADTSSLERREWRDTIEDPAEAAAQSATRNADAGDPGERARKRLSTLCCPCFHLEPVSVDPVFGPLFSSGDGSVLSLEALDPLSDTQRNQ